MAYSVDLKLRKFEEGKVAVALLGAFFILHFLQKMGIGPEFIRYYFKDVILVPLLVIAIKMCGELLGRKLAVNKKELLITVVYVSVAFEWILPKLELAYPGDWIDVCCYAIGAWLYNIYIVEEN
jgi:hypothetical protein